MKKCPHCDITHDKATATCTVCKNGLRRYGMTRLDMLALHKKQKGKCYLCNTKIEMFVGARGGMIDHCHTTGKVRSILCCKCNVAVGGIETHKNVKKLLEYVNLK
jgi:hypothetical protein